MDVSSLTRAKAYGCRLSAIEWNRWLLRRRTEKECEEILFSGKKYGCCFRVQGGDIWVLLQMFMGNTCEWCFNTEEGNMWVLIRNSRRKYEDVCSTCS